MMKKLCLALATCATLGMNFNAMADNHTVSLGYQEGRLPDLYNMSGVNLKYRYEWDSPVSIITSFSYMGGGKTYEEKRSFTSHHKEWKSKSFGLALGPTYRLNEFVSIYGLAGVNFSKFDHHATKKYHTSNTEKHWDGHANKTSLMYGAGVQINPIENVSIDFGYEGYRLTIDEFYSKPVHNLNVGLGYRF
jgi:putative virulence related protein PagC